MAKSLYTIPESVDIVTLYQQSIDLPVLFKQGALRKDLAGAVFVFEVYDYYANETFLSVSSQSSDSSKQITVGSSVGGTDTVRDMVRIKVGFIGTSNKPLEVSNYANKLSYTSTDTESFVLHGRMVVLESMNSYYDNGTQNMGAIEIVFNQNEIVVQLSNNNSNTAPSFEYLIEINGDVSL